MRKTPLNKLDQKNRSAVQVCFFLRVFCEDLRPGQVPEGASEKHEKSHMRRPAAYGFISVCMYPGSDPAGSAPADPCSGPYGAVYEAQPVD